MIDRAAYLAAIKAYVARCDEAGIAPRGGVVTGSFLAKTSRGRAIHVPDEDHTFWLVLDGVATRLAAVLALLLLLASPTAAQDQLFRWKSHEAIPSRISDAAVAAQIAAAVVDDWRSEDRKGALLHDLCAAGATVLAAEGLKRAFPRWRPNRKDRKSFPSMHSGVAASLAGWNRGWGIGLTAAVGWGRNAGGWHYLTDIGPGIALGAAAAKLCPGD